jgi:hypothetical protein
MHIRVSIVYALLGSMLSLAQSLCVTTRSNLKSLVLVGLDWIVQLVIWARPTSTREAAIIDPRIGIIGLTWYQSLSYISYGNSSFCLFVGQFW